MLCLLTIVCLTFVTVVAQKCEPGVNCKLPNCHCSNDNDVPGKLDPKDTPQMVLLTFEESLTEENSELYRSLFKQSNPNGCPPRGTFFVRGDSTEYEVVMSMYNEGHEFGAGSKSGVVPQTQEQWREDLSFVKQKLTEAGVAESDVLGVRAPTLSVGGLEEFIAMGNNGFLYEASCITSEYTLEGNIKWPYTYDYVEDVPTCNIGKTLSVSFPGKWQFLIPAFRYKDEECAVPQGCNNILTERDAFDMMFENFIKHYNGKRAPFVIIITADFAETDFKLAGIRQFLEFIRAAFEDTWVVTARQALQWIQDPTPNANLTDFAPWKC